MEAKVYSLFGKNGVMEEIKPVGELPVGTRILAFGAGMSDQVFCITGSKTERGQEMCLVSNFYEGAYFSPRHYFDKYSRPLSAKFGIGFYWDDVENIVYPETTVKAAIRRADYLERKISEREAAIAEADRKEIQALPALYPHLKPYNPKEDSYKQLKANIVADLKANFPTVKFSIKKRSGDAIYISWTNGPTKRKVEEVTRKYTDHVTDFTGDFRDYEPSNFNRVFGGTNYIFEEREKTEEIEKLVAQLADMHKYQNKYDADSDLHSIFCKTSFPKDACNFRVERTEITCGSIHEVFKIAFDFNQTEQEKKIEVNGIEIVDYSDKSFAIIGDTKPIKDILKNLGGSFNARLTCGMGWIFPLTKKEAVLSELGL